jgi:hypothetical protein
MSGYLLHKIKSTLATGTVVDAGRIVGNRERMNRALPQRPWQDERWLYMDVSREHFISENGTQLTL